MAKKVVAAFTAVVFVVFSTSCMTWRTKEIRTSADAPRPSWAVLSVVKKSGEVVKFPRKAPARIVGNQIVGTYDVIEEREVEVGGPFPLITRLDDGTVVEVTDATGRAWSVRKVIRDEPNKMTLLVADHVTGSVVIPLSEIRQVKIRRTNTVLTVLTVVSVLGAAWLGYGVYVFSRE